MNESHIKIEQINSVTITPKIVYSYIYLPEKTREVTTKTKWYKADRKETVIRQTEVYKLTQIEPKEPANNQAGLTVYYGSGGSGPNTFFISVDDYKDSKEFDGVVCGGYKHDGKNIFTLPYATFELINEQGMRQNYIKYFKTIEKARKFVDECLDKSESKFTIL